jgi:endoplasmic reticulum Man9GlcNAc2 1,2-alpha-mannosidase
MPQVLIYNIFSDWNLQAKQDHLVCFLGGSLLLGVTEGHGSFPPNWKALSVTQKRDWTTGTELIKTCVATYNTETYGFDSRDCAL